MSITMIVGDAHLGASLRLGRPGIGSALNGRVLDQIKLLNWLLDQAIEYNVETIIFTGDIFEDVKPDFVLMDLFLSFLKQCEVHNLTIHLIAGNHDLKRSGNYYSSILDLVETCDLPHIFFHKHLKTVYQDGVGFTLMPFRDRRSLNCDSNAEALKVLAQQLPYELADIPLGCDRVLIGHLALEGALPVGNEFDDYANELMCPLEMFKGYDYVWMGHIHKPQVRCQEPYLAHIGSLDLSDFGETDHQKIVIIYDSAQPKGSKFQELLVPSRPLRKIELTIPEDTENTTLFVTDYLQQLAQNKSLKSAIVSLELKLVGSASPNVDRVTIEQFLSALGVHYLCNFSESRKVTVVPIAKQQLTDSIIDPKAAIKIWAEQLKLDSEEIKSRFLEISYQILDKVQAKN